MIIPEVTIEELVNDLDKDIFFEKYGNPVRVEIYGKNYALLSIELHERLFGKTELTDKNTIEIDDFLKDLEENIY